MFDKVCLILNIMNVKFGENVLIFDEDHYIDFSKSSTTSNKIPEIDLKSKFPSIQYNRNHTKILIPANDLKIINLNENLSVSLNEKFKNFNQNQIENIFWSRIEDNILIIQYKDRIDLFNIDSFEKIKSINIEGLTKCKQINSSSILSRFCLLAMINDTSFIIITPVVSNDFILSRWEYNDLKSSINNYNSAFLENSFYFDNDSDNYKFMGLFGDGIDYAFFPINLDFDSKVIDFECKNNIIYIKTEDGGFHQAFLSQFPSFFDPVLPISCNVKTNLNNIPIDSFISLYGTPQKIFGLNSNSLFQLFDSCIVSVYDIKEGAILKSIQTKKDGSFLLFFDNGVIDTITDQAVYYENDLKLRYKEIQERKELLKKLKSDIEEKLRNFQSVLDKLVSIDDINKLLKRIESLEVESESLSNISEISSEIAKIKASLPQNQKKAVKSYVSNSNYFKKKSHMISNLRSSIEKK